MLKAFTNDCVEIMNTAREQIGMGQELRVKSLQLMKECFENAKSMGASVDEAFVKKINDTLALNVIIYLFSQFFLSLKKKLLINFFPLLKKINSSSKT